MTEVADLETTRRGFVEQIRYRARIRSKRLLSAFASVPREQFMEAGPWRIRSDLVPGYWTTENADPCHLYHDVLIAIDEAERLDNGLPSLWAFLFEAVSIQPGDHVVHIGCGTGYYTAILAELVRPNGLVSAIERDAGLAKQASLNLAHLQQVTVIHGDGCLHDTDMADAILVNAGASAPAELWLDRLAIGGRLLLPLTIDSRQGTVFLITRHEQGFKARSLTGIEIFSCDGARTKKGTALLQVAFWKEKPDKVKLLRRDRHAATDSCWLHTKHFCLSKQG